MYFRCNLLSCAFLFSIFFSVSNANILLQRPREISQEEVAERAKNLIIEFNWNHNYWLNLTCWYEHEQAGFIAKVFGIPVYRYGHRQHTNAQNRDSKRGYYFAQPLKITGEQPQYITIDELARMLRDKICVFYTGAGISAAEHVATMAQLEESLGMKQGKKAFVYN